MPRFMSPAPIAVAAALLVAGLGPAALSSATATAATSTCGGSGTASTVTGTLPDKATYLIQCPAGKWNGTVLLFSHGYVTPGSANPAADSFDPVTGNWLLGHGYALAGSSYASTGWAIQQALPDQIATLNTFGADYGKPKRTIAWGDSLGGIITAGLIQRYPHRFAGALPMCGVLSGAVGVWNNGLDAAFAFQKLVDPKVAVVNITDPSANLTGAIAAVNAAQSSAKGRARIALGAALSDTPGWFVPLTAKPGARDYNSQEENQLLWDTQVDFPFAFAFRAELEARAGGNPSWTTGVNFRALLRKSADYREVVHLYRAAHLSLSRDLRTLNRARPVRAKPSAVSYLRRNLTFSGRLRVPVLTMHTTGDGLVVPENEQAYASVVKRAGDSRLLRQIFVSRAGHCAFTPAETVTALRTLLRRLATGHWDAAALRPARLDKAAAGLGASFNIFLNGSKVVATAPRFTAYRPALFLRPYDLGRPPRS